MKILLPEVKNLNDSYAKNILRFQKFSNSFLPFKKLIESIKKVSVFFFILTGFLISNSALAQSSTESDEQWILKSDSAGIKTYYQVSKCDNGLVFLLKIENSNDKDFSISWEKEISKSETNNLFSIVVLANKTIITNCEQSPVVLLKQSADSELPVSMHEAVTQLVIKIQSK